MWWTQTKILTEANPHKQFQLYRNSHLIRIYKSEFFITIFQVEIQSFLFTETIEDFYHETFPRFANK